MDELKINLNEYISNDKKEKIAEEVFTCAVKNVVQESDFVERIFVNLCYKVVWKIVDEVMAESGLNLQEMITAKIIEIINNLTSYSVFRTKEAYFQKKDSLGQQLLEDAITDNCELINKNVKKIINNYNYNAVKEAIEDRVYECICENIFKPKENE